MREHRQSRRWEVRLQDRTCLGFRNDEPSVAGAVLMAQCNKPDATCQQLRKNSLKQFRPVRHRFIGADQYNRAIGIGKAGA